MRPNTYTDEYYATKQLQHLEAHCNPRPDLGLLIIVLYLALLGLFIYWVLAGCLTLAFWLWCLN